MTGCNENQNSTPVDAESYSLNHIAVFCNRWSKLLAKFVFKMSAYRFNICP